MGQIWYQLITCFDYVNRYLTLKIARAMIPAVILMLLVLVIRRCLEERKENEICSMKLYIRCYLWLVLLLIPFMGELRLSYEHLRWRNRIYVFLYEIVLGHPIVARLYFAGMAVLAVWFIVRKIRLGRWIKRLEIYKEHEMAKRIEIRISPLDVSPFATGIFRHTIVLPKYIIEEFETKEMEEILQHEFNHIKRGHLVIYTLIDLFRILWFMNPLAHICAKRIREDMELMCDYTTIRNNLYLPEKYGMVLIKSMKWMNEEKGKKKMGKVTPAFAAEKSFALMKKRIRMIAGYTEYPRNRGKIICAVSGLVTLALFILVRQLSYPIYTPYNDFSLYSYDSTEVIFQNNKEFDSAITMKESGLMVDNKKIKEMLSKEEKYDEKESYWIYFGGFMKQPGIGGGGDVVEYSPGNETEDMTFISCNEKGRISEIIEWILKHM